MPVNTIANMTIKYVMPRESKIGVTDAFSVLRGFTERFLSSRQQLNQMRTKVLKRHTFGID